MKRKGLTLLEEVQTDEGTIQIMLSPADGVITYYQDSCLHSQTNAQGVSTCVYIHVMHEIIRQVAPKRVLLIGGAGGTLATMLARLDVKVTMVDINPLAFTLAKKYFQLPDEVECVVADGRAFLKDTAKTFDAVAIDVFDQKGIIPDAFTTEAFFSSLKSVLAPAGVIAMNVMTKHDMDFAADRVALTMESVGLASVLYDWQGIQDRNTIVAAGALKTVRIPSGKEPVWLKPELKGLGRRKPKKHAFEWVG